MPLKERKKARRNLPLKIFSTGKKLSIKQSKIYSTLFYSTPPSYSQSERIIFCR